MRHDELWRERLDSVLADFHNRVDSDDVFRARLYGLGFRGAELKNEFNYQELLRHEVEQHKTLNGKLKIA